MPELSKNNINSIDKALQKIGIAYTDIRYELTDHVANVLENHNGDFENELENYIRLNKKQLKQLNLKMFFIGAGRAYKKLGQTLLTPAFIIGNILLFAVAMLGSFIAGQEVIVYSLLLFFCVAGSYSSFLYLYRTFRFRRQFSGDVVYSFSILILLWLSIFILEWSESVNSITVNLYYTFTVICAAAIAITFNNQYKYYKLKYR